jgi:glycine/D-amino acid oxidase-like deaminating enzyme
MSQIDEIVERERLVCDFAWVPGYLHAPPDQSSADREWLQEEARIASEMGFDATFVDDVPLVHSPGVQFDRQARIHPRQYLAGLLRGIVRKGGQIYEHSGATDFSEHPRFVEANGYRIACGDIVISTHNPLVGNQSLVSATLFHTRIALYSTYVVAGRVKKNTVPDVLLWDTADPYHYYRVEAHRDFDLVIYGGEDHKTGQEPATARRFARLEAGLRRLAPEVAITHRWSGQVIESHDGLPFIGEQAEHQFMGTAYSGNGLTFGTLAAMMATDHILGKSNPWTDLFSTDRRFAQA